MIESMIDGHSVTINQFSPVTFGAVCQCGVTAVSGSQKRCEQMIHRKHVRNAQVNVRPMNGEER